MQRIASAALRGRASAFSSATKSTFQHGRFISAHTGSSFLSPTKPFAFNAKSHCFSQNTLSWPFAGHLPRCFSTTTPSDGSNGPEEKSQPIGSNQKIISSVPAIIPKCEVDNPNSVARSKTALVETIHGRARRFMFDTRTDTLKPQWMWGDDEAAFEKMMATQRNANGKVSLFERMRGAGRSLSARLQASFHSTLLPAGYPDSVHSCYVSFSSWQFLETIFGSLTHVLCAQAMLSSVGLASTTAAVGGAVAIRWILKDGLANFAKLAFTKYFAHGFDFRPRTWGVVSEGLYLAGGVFEISTALAASLGYPGLFVPLAAIGASLHAVAHLAWEATHANFIRWLSLRNNIADVTAKADSQMVVAELLGLGAGVVLIQSWHAPLQLFAIFAVAAPFHLLFTFCRLRSLRFGMLSMSRVLELSNMYIRHHHSQHAQHAAAAGLLAVQPIETPHFGRQIPTSAKVLEFPSPDDCHKVDKLFGEWYFPRDWKSQFGYCNLELGAIVSDAFVSEAELMGAVHVYRDELYLLNYRLDTNTIYVSFEEDCEDHDILKSLLQANKLAYDLQRFGVVPPSVPEAPFALPATNFAALAQTHERQALSNQGATQLANAATNQTSQSRELIGKNVYVTMNAPHAPPQSQTHQTASPHSLSYDPTGLIRESLTWTRKHLDRTKTLLEKAGWDTEVVVWSDVGNRVYWEEAVKTAPHLPPGYITRYQSYLQQQMQQQQQQQQTGNSQK